MPSSSKANTDNVTKFPPWVWLLYFLVLWQVLLCVQNPGLMSDDSGEMASAAFNLGLPHPPGYPFFNLIGHLATLVQIGSIAFRLNLFSAFLTLFSLFFTLDVMRRMDDLSGKRDSRVSGFKREALLAVIGVVFFSFRGTFAQSLTAK